MSHAKSLLFFSWLKLARLLSMKHKNYAERDSQFFRLKSRQRLAGLLFTGKHTLERIGRQEGLYHQFEKMKKDGGSRLISAPRQELKTIQKRIAILLQRIAPPEYLFAPVPGRSYVDNAAIHRGAECFRLLDIEDFFPNCTANKVIWFFHKRMECSSDVSAILRGLVTYNGSLPQGSPCSPILAYLCYVDMWEEINQIVSKAHCTLSVYADDITISGDLIPEKTIWEIKKVLRRNGHRHSTKKEQSKLRTAEITGVILRPDGLHAPNRQHKKLHELRIQQRRTNSVKGKVHLNEQLIGRQSQLGQISSKNS